MLNTPLGCPDQRQLSGFRDPTMKVGNGVESCQIKVGRSVKISAFDLQRVDVQIRHIDIALTEPVSLPCSGVTG